MSLLNFFPQVSATLTRPTGSYVNGRWSAGTTTATPITIIRPQPAAGKDLQILPEGDRAYAHLTTWSVTELQVNDVLNFASTNYRVIHAEDWSLDSGGFRAMIRKVQSGN